MSTTRRQMIEAAIERHNAKQSRKVVAGWRLMREIFDAHVARCHGGDAKKCVDGCRM